MPGADLHWGQEPDKKTITPSNFGTNRTSRGEGSQVNGVKIGQGMCNLSQSHLTEASNNATPEDAATATQDHWSPGNRRGEEEKSPRPLAFV